jgi:long-chain acyl-CoA synthetase
MGTGVMDARTLAHAWRDRVAATPDARCLIYFDTTLTVREVDELSSALAPVLADRGVAAHDVVGISLQNVPLFPLCLLALWKLRATALLVNPMHRQGELRHLLHDAGAVGVVCDAADAPFVSRCTEGTSVRWLLTTSPHEFQNRNDQRVLPVDRIRPDPAHDLMAAMGGAAAAAFDPASPCRPGDCALLTYTSGTTGPAKGAINTHRSVLATATAFARWIDLNETDVVYAMAPMFHITGAVINAVMALLAGAPLVLGHRFHPDVAADLIREHAVTYTAGSITAFLALGASERASRETFRSVRALYSGGAPIPPAAVEDFERRFGHRIHNVYGLTESTSAVVAVPLGSRAPVDPASGALSVGLPLPGTELRVVDPQGHTCGTGIAGELEISGDSVVPGYWRNPDATRVTFPHGRLRTGDGAIIDHDGWVYIVDRLKDQINTSGYKVWPREVEDVLHQHPAVAQAAVAGVPDAYRGERVTAFVKLCPGADLRPEDLIRFARQHLAAYKAPREVRFVDALPMTSTGKVRRRALVSSAGGRSESDSRPGEFTPTEGAHR